MQERVTDTGATKVDANVKSDAPNDSDASKIDTPNIHVRREIVKPCAVVIALSIRVYLI